MADTVRPEGPREHVVPGRDTGPGANSGTGGREYEPGATASSLEHELRERLRGVRLVFEAIDPDLRGRVILKVLSLARLRADAEVCLARDYPAILVTYLVAEGIYQYSGGTYWPNLPVKGLDPNRLGPGFLYALRALGLETFEMLAEEGALRYVAPILAHGGIPCYCLRDFFFSLLVPELRRSGSADASELLAIWRTRKTAFQGIDVPVKRFLLYGGETALDLLDRCVELVAETARIGRVPSPDEVGLPRHIVRGFETGPIEEARVKGPSVPRPRVRLDPWDPLGPVLELPPVPRELAFAMWRVSDGRSVRDVRGSSTESRTLHLGPARAWDVELVSDGRLVRNAAFECLEETPTVVFDPDAGLLLRDSRTIPLDSAWVLHPSDAKLVGVLPDGVETALPVQEELPDPVGPWRGFRLAHYDLRGLRAIRAEWSGLPTPVTLRVSPPGQRPELEGTSVSDVTTDDGYPVFSQPPTIRIPAVADVSKGAWRIYLRCGPFQRSGSAADFGGLEFDLATLGGGSLSGLVHLVVRGPLGSDLRVSFAIVPGLAIERPQDLLLPGSFRAAHIRVSAGSGARLDGRRAGESVALAVPQDTDEVQCGVELNGQPVLLRIYVAKVLWAIVRASKVAATFAAQLVRVGIEELEDGTGVALVVSTRWPEVPVSLALEYRGASLQETQTQRTSARQGRAVFDLAPFRDTVRASGHSSFDLVLRIADRRVPVGNILAKLLISGIQAISETRDGDMVVRLSFEESRLLRARVARLWSLDRPWETPFTTPISDDVSGHAVVSGPILPGRYRAEIALDDPWSFPRRPRRGDANCADIFVGTLAASIDRLDTLDASNPFVVLELAIRRGQIVRWLDPEDLSKIAQAALQSTLELLVEADYAERAPSSLDCVSNLLFRNLEAGYNVIAEAYASGLADRADLLRVGLLQLPRIVRHNLVRTPHKRLRGTWEACAPLAASVDAPAAWRGDPEALSRCEAFLGWSPGTDPPIGRAADQAILGRSADELRQIYRVLDLVPRQLLSLDSFVAANFEWLLLIKEKFEMEFELNRAPVQMWMVAHQDLLEKPLLVSPAARRYLDARKRPVNAAEWGAFPQLVLVCALHVFAGSEYAWRAAAALRQATSVAARLAAHDLCLAAVLTPAPGGGEERDA